MAVIIPQKITFREWINLLRTDYPNANIPQDVNEDAWREYAWLIINDPAFSAKIPPTPDVYAEPIKWIQAFSNAIY